MFLLSLATVGCPSGSGGGGDQTPPAESALTVRTTPQDAQITVRDAGGALILVAQDGARHVLDPATYSIGVDRVGYHSQAQQVQVSGETSLDVSLTAESPVQPLPCGPLRVSTANPRYFADRCKTRYLAGLHTWNNLIDMGVSNPPRAFDFDFFLHFLGTYNANVIRLWAWETPHPEDTETAFRDWTAPQPWLRTGPGTAVDGLPKFDLGVLDEAYFVRMRERVRALQDAGVYTIVMLFDGWSVQWSPGKDSDPYNGPNNANNIAPASLRDVDTLNVPAIVNVQEAYVRKVIDTLNDFDNVMYEIANEAVVESVDWQYHMIAFVEGYENAKPKQHLVGMTWPWGANNSVLFNGPADWVSPLGTLDPDPATGSKVIVYDNDHIGGSQFGNQIWVWKSFTRGYNPLFMDCYVPPDGLCESVYPYGTEIRRALGATRRYAERMDLSTALPRGDLASSGYCLANDTELAVFVPTGGPVTVTLPASGSPFNAEWYDPSGDTVHPASPVAGGAATDFIPPFSGPAVLFLWIPHP